MKIMFLKILQTKKLCKLLSIGILCILIQSISSSACVSKTDWQEPVYIRGDTIVSTLESSGITPKTALNSIKKLESMEKSNTIIELPQILYNLAQFKLYLGFKHNENNYVKNHIDQYTYIKDNDIYLYNCNELNDILKNYNFSILTDEAAFILSTLPPINNCNGNIPCILLYKTESYMPYIKYFDNTDYYRIITEDINSVLADFISNNDYKFNDDNEKDKFITGLNKYLDIIVSLKSRNKSDSLYIMAQAFQKAGNLKKAQDLYMSIISNYPDFEHLMDIENHLDAIFRQNENNVQNNSPQEF